MMSTYSDHLKVMSQFLGKSDGKDKLCATIQYACLFLCAGAPGNIKKIQASVAAARKVFRILKPIEALMPIIVKPGFDATTPFLLQILGKIKALCMASYFAFDHVAWMGHAGLVSDADMLKRCQKVSLNSWLSGSCCVIVDQCSKISKSYAELRGITTGDDLPSRRAAIRRQIRTQAITLLHAVLQAILAFGLLQYAPIGMRYVGLIGTITSALHIYMIFPAAAEKEKKN